MGGELVAFPWLALTSFDDLVHCWLCDDEPYPAGDLPVRWEGGQYYLEPKCGCSFLDLRRPAT